MKISSLNKLKKIKYLKIFLIILTAIITSCTQNAEKKLEKGLELYINGEASKATAYIEDGLINSALIKKLKVSHLLFGENLLFYKQKKIIKIVWPLELDIEISDKYNLVCYFPDSNKFGLSNGYDIKLYDSAGSIIKTCGPTPDDKRVKAFTLINENIYYYKDKKVFIYDPATDAEKQLSNPKSPAPIDNESYDAKFYKAGGLLAVAAGLAGRYYLNVYDLKNNNALITNLETASLKLLFQNDEIYYITGSAGKYAVAKMQVSSKKLKNLLEFNNLKDIEFFASGILFEDKDGLWIAGFENASKQKIPFRYELAGQYTGNPVIKYANMYYVTDAAKFADTITRIKEKAPSVFDTK